MASGQPSLLVVIAAALALYGAAVWFGAYRSWTEEDLVALRSRNLMVPWLGVGGCIFLGLTLTESAFVQQLGTTLLMLCCLLAMTVALFEWPRRALPPWYRRIARPGHREPGGTRHRR